jgi:hypothetical protein
VRIARKRIERFENQFFVRFFGCLRHFVFSFYVIVSEGFAFTAFFGFGSTCSDMASTFSDGATAFARRRGESRYAGRANNSPRAASTCFT